MKLAEVKNPELELTMMEVNSGKEVEIIEKSMSMLF